MNSPTQLVLVVNYQWVYSFSARTHEVVYSTRLIVIINGVTSTLKENDFSNEPTNLINLFSKEK